MQKKVAIILGYYNGEEFINELILSIFSQSFSNFHIYLFDDKSSIPFDMDSLNLDLDQKKKITICRREKNLGFSMNFLKGLSEINDNYDYYSYCDQDDIWHKDKLLRGIETLEAFNSTIPMLYGTKTWISDKKCTKILSESISIKRPLSFKNAILQSFAGGNTMIFNLSAKRLIINNLNLINPVSHDWWSYLLISGYGGKIFYDPKPSLFYRQHKGSQSGSNKSWIGRLSRLFMLIRGDFRIYMQNNINSLNISKNNLNNENKKILEVFTKGRKSNFINRFYLYIKSGVYRQNLIGSIIFLVFFIFKRI